MTFNEASLAANALLRNVNDKIEMINAVLFIVGLSSKKHPLSPNSNILRKNG